MELRKFIATTVREYLNEQQTLKENNNINNVIDLVFSYSPTLIDIGTKKQYNEYMETIHPNSKYKDVVFHATKTEENRNNILQNGFDFSRIQNKLRGDGLSIATDVEFTKGFGDYPMALKINVNTITSSKEIRVNNLNEKDFDLITDYSYGLITAGVITNPHIIHNLGSQKDIGEFKKYVGV